jgi:hypothetical protein
MARRRKNYQAAPMTLTFATSITGGGVSTATDYIDLSQVASLVNRRFYRQGLNWAVAGFKLFTKATFSGQVQMFKLPNTWIMSNAWTKSFKAWQKMNRDALAETESIKPRFMDFKIYADAGHHSAGFGANLLPLAQATVYTAGEWQPSKIVQPDSSQGTPTVYDRELIAVGANYPGAGASGLNAVSLIEGYAASRALPNILDPNRPADADDADGTAPQNWMSAMFNEGQPQDAEVIEDLTDDNNIAPYPFENDGVHADTMYPGGANQGGGLETHDITFITPTTIGGMSYLKGGNFPCGLIRIDTLNDPAAEESLIILQVDMIPGPHRGYLAESMTEM